MPPKRELLAQRFDKRLKQAPARGAIVATQTRTAPARPAALSPATPPARSPARPVPRPTPGPTVEPASRIEPAANQAILSETRALRLRNGRGAPGGRLRGHLVPREVHSEARRRKLRLEAEQGRRITWDEVATEALELLLSKRAQAMALVDEVRTISERSPSGRRLVQSTIASKLDRQFSELRLDLSDKLGRDVSYELLWGSALLLWVRSS